MKALSNYTLLYCLEPEVFCFFFLRGFLGELVHTSEHAGRVVQIRIVYVSFKPLNDRLIEERLVSCHLFSRSMRCLQARSISGCSLRIGEKKKKKKTFLLQLVLGLRVSRVSPDRGNDG